MTFDQAEAFMSALDGYVAARIEEGWRRQRGEYASFLAAGERAELARKTAIAILVASEQPGADDLGAARALTKPAQTLRTLVNRRTITPCR